MTWSRGGICTDPPAGHGQRPANTWRGAKSNGRESDCVCMKEGTGGEEAPEVGSEYHLVSKELSFLARILSSNHFSVSHAFVVCSYICTRTRKSEDLPQPFGPVTRRCLEGARGGGRGECVWGG